VPEVPGSERSNDNESCMLAGRDDAASTTQAWRRHAPLAQSAERLHGKEKVYGSIP
jgi:hypothetical protein